MLVQPQASPLTHRWQEVARNTQLRPRPPARSPDTGRLWGAGGGAEGRAGQGPQGPAEPRSGRGSPPLRMQPSRGPRQGGCRGAGAAGRGGTEERGLPAECCRGGASGEAGGRPPQPRLMGQWKPDHSNCPIHHVPEPQWGQRPSLCLAGLSFADHSPPASGDRVSPAERAWLSPPHGSSSAAGSLL